MYYIAEDQNEKLTDSTEISMLNLESQDVNQCSDVWGFLTTEVEQERTW